MKTKVNNKRIKKSDTPVVDTPVVVTPVVVTPVVVTPVVNGVEVNPGSGELIMGSPINSKRITPGARIDTYRVCTSQRKTDNARYYVQGGFTRVDPQSLREFFVVSVEIPHTDLFTAKTQMVALNKDLLSALAVA